MRQLPAITAAALASLLLVGCQSDRDRKREICAQWVAATGSWDSTEDFIDAARSTWKKLGIESSYPSPVEGKGLRHHADADSQIRSYCEFYKS